MSVISISNLNVYLKTESNRSPEREKGVNLVKNLDIKIKESEVFGLVGESGCGKSMTAYSIMDILPRNIYYEGDIIFEGRNLKDLSAKEKRKIKGNRISMIFQEPMTSLNPVLTVGYQIAEVLKTHRNMNRSEAKERSVELLRSVRIPSPDIRFNDYPHQLSGGMRQRIMIAMAIACDPALLIADEPTTALDVTIQSQILHLLRGIKDEKNMSLLLITHDLGIISENAQRVAIMYAGRIMELTSAELLFKDPKHPYTIGLLESLPREKSAPLKPVPGTVPRPENLPKGCKFSNRCSYADIRCTEMEPELRSISEDHLVRCIKSDQIKWIC